MNITKQQVRRIIRSVLKEQASRVRPVHEIADEIMKSWKDIPAGAKPYLKAMRQITSVADTYGKDDGREIVLKFLDVPGVDEWEGPDADRLKGDLKAAMRVV